MKKNRMKKLNLSRETLLALDITGGAVLGDIAGPVVAKPITDTETISICKYCTTPLDNCPNPTIAVA